MSHTKEEALAILKEYLVGMPDSEGSEVYAIHEDSLNELADRFTTHPIGMPKVEKSDEINTPL